MRRVLHLLEWTLRNFPEADRGRAHVPARLPVGHVGKDAPADRLAHPSAKGFGRLDALLSHLHPDAIAAGRMPNTCVLVICFLLRYVM